MKQRSAKFNASLNVIRSVSSVLIVLVTVPYVTRVLQTESYGKVGFALSIVSYFQLIAMLGINSYAIREGAAIRNNQEKINAFASRMFSINIISTLLAYFLLFVLLLLWRKTDAYRDIILIHSLTIVLTTMSLNWVFNIFESFTHVTVRAVLFQAMMIPMLFIFVKQPDDYIKYVTILVIVALATCLCNMIEARTMVQIKFTLDMQLNKHLGPIMILFANAALITLYLNSDTTILGVFKGDEAVGLYSLSVKIYTTVKEIINAIVVVLIPRIAFYIGEEKQEEYKKITKVSFEAILVVLFPALTGLFMISKNAIWIIAGESYLGGVSALKILSIALFFAVLANFFVNGIMLTHKKEKEILVATLLSAILNIGLNFVFIPLFSLNGAAFTTLLAEITVTTISVLCCRKLFDFSGHARTIGVTILGCVAIVGVCLLINIANLNIVFDTLIKIFGSAAVYFIVQLCLNKRFILDFIHSK